MKIKYVTITGADNSIEPLELVYLSKKYPFVEWGILLSESKTGDTRFPTHDWLRRLVEVQREHNLNLSAHVCQKWCRDVFNENKMTIATALPDIWPIFQRIQLNFSPYDVGLVFVDNVLKQYPEKQFIFQVGKKNRDSLFSHAVHSGANIACLFDRSGGKGVVPSSWPKVREDVLCGYAGGLGPETLAEEIEKISQVVGDKEIWIDMESQIRSKDLATGQDFFDLVKVERCLEVVSK
jgi:hypothetical protein